MKNILFINTIDNLEENRDKYKFSLGQLSLATILNKNNYNVKLIDFDNLYWKNVIKDLNDVDSMVEYILNLNPDLVDFYTMCNSYHISLDIAKKLKEKRSSIKIVFGGPHAALTGIESIEKFPYIDVIAVGEGEETILDIAKRLLDNDDLNDVSGVIFRKKNQVVYNPKKNLIKDLDKLPFLNYSLINIEEVKVMPLDVGRGCPFGCKYCSTKSFWKRNFRLKSSSRIVEEIKYIVSKYNIRNFDFIHDLFTANKDKLLEFCNLIVLEKIKINWCCSARIDTLDEEIIKKMHEAGCRYIFLGIETGSLKMQKKINKNLKLNLLSYKIGLLKKYNFNITASFIYGFPEEELDDINQTLNKINELKKMGVENTQLHLFSVLPGTEFFENMKNQLQISSNFSDISGAKKIEEKYKDLILKNPLIFSQYFEINSSVRRETRYLDKFMRNYYIVLFKYLPKTYELIMQYYNNNILNIFIDFKRINEKFLSKLYDYGDYPKQTFLQRNELIKNYINFYNFGNNTSLIRELFKFESNIIEFMYFRKENEFVKNYKHDVYEIKQSGKFVNQEKYNSINVKFTRIKDKNINIKKVL